MMPSTLEQAKLAWCRALAWDHAQTAAAKAASPPTKRQRPTLPPRGAGKAKIEPTGERRPARGRHPGPKPSSAPNRRQIRQSRPERERGHNVPRAPPTGTVRQSAQAQSAGHRRGQPHPKAHRSRVFDIRSRAQDAAQETGFCEPLCPNESSQLQRVPIDLARGGPHEISRNRGDLPENEQLSGVRREDDAQRSRQQD